MSCNGFHGWEWRLVPERKGSRTRRCKVVKVVSLEVFLSGPSSDRFSSLQTHGHHGEADRGEASAFSAEQARCFPGSTRSLSPEPVGSFLEPRLNVLGSFLWILRS